MNGVTHITVFKMMLLDHMMPMNFLMLGQMAGTLAEGACVLHRVKDGLADEFTPVGQMCQCARQVAVDFKGNGFLLGDGHGVYLKG